MEQQAWPPSAETSPAAAGPAAAADPSGPTGPWSRRDANVRRALALARAALGLDVAWVADHVAGEQVFRYVDAATPGAGPSEGSSERLASSYCVRVLDGRLPGLIPNALADPGTRDLEVTRALDIGAYAGVPITRADGTVRGMLCATSSRPAPALRAQDLAVLELVAALVAALTDDEIAHHNLDLQAEVLDSIGGSGRRQVLQPIVDVRTGHAVGAESLARFADPPRRPDLWFAMAEEVGLRIPLELAAARTALEGLAARDGYVSINLSPDAITSGGLATLLEGHDPTRIVVEVTEHAAVGDYAALVAALAPHRDAGVRLAIDDAGAGYASFRHIIEVRPDFIKVDVSLVRDVNQDPVRQALIASLVVFGRAAGAQLVAEGVETQAELDTLARLGITLVQGYLLARPGDAPVADGYGGPSRHVVIDAATDLAVVIAEAVRDADDLEGLTRRLLDAVLALTGLESSYLTVLQEGRDLEHRFVRNVGRLEVPEGLTIPWERSLCSGLRAAGRSWTSDAARDLDDRPAAADFGVSTFLSLPLSRVDGELVGTLCAASTEPVFISEAVLAQVQLVAYVLGTEMAKRR